MPLLSMPQLNNATRIMCVAVTRVFKQYSSNLLSIVRIANDDRSASDTSGCSAVNIQWTMLNECHKAYWICATPSPHARLSLLTTITVDERHVFKNSWEGKGPKWLAGWHTASASIRAASGMLECLRLRAINRRSIDASKPRKAACLLNAAAAAAAPAPPAVHCHSSLHPNCTELLKTATS